MKMAKIMMVGFTVLAIASTGAMAKSSDNAGKNHGDATDGQVEEYTKKEYKDCYAANPGCSGECLDEGDGLVCTYPDGEDVESFDLCAGDKKNSGNWQPWIDGESACTCAPGFVTLAKVREQYADSDKLPKAKDLCTYECDVEPECVGSNGPLDCFCPGADEAGEEYISKKDEASAEKDLLDQAKEDYNDAVAAAKDEYETAKDTFKEDFETAKADIKNGDNPDVDADDKEAVKEAIADLKDEYESNKEAAKDLYETAKSDAKDEYETAKEEIKGSKHDEDVEEVKKAAPAKPEAAKPAAAKPTVVVAAVVAKPAAAVPATPAPKA